MSLPINNEPRVQTAIRVRVPFPSEDIYTNVVPNMNLLHMGTTVTPHKADYMFGIGYPQEMIFETAAKPLLDKFLRAEEHISILTYGPHQTGKTFTLFGPGVELTESAVLYGIYPRFASYLFSQFDPAMFAGDDPTVKVYVAFFEIQENRIRSLLKNSVSRRYSESRTSAIKTQDFLSLLDYEMCRSARHMIRCLNIALNNQTQRLSSHISALVIIDQPALKDGQYSRVQTSAIFTDVGSTVMDLPQCVRPHNRNRSEILVQEDRYVLSSLAVTIGGIISDEMTVPEENHICNVLKSSFNGERATLVFCCIAPSAIEHALSNDYLSTLNTIGEMRNKNHKGPDELPRNKNHQGNKTNSLISEAESLLSRLAVSKSISDEDQEKLKNWLHMKKECEDDSLNAQSHGQLECIEEVTESEEEIASSDEKMSESPVSLDNSLSESDQEEGDSKLCQLSDNGFFNSLDNMCVQFNTFVDKYVDSFKGKTSLSPAKERKRDYSAARRGGMSELPKVNELQAQVDSMPSSLKFVEPQLTRATNQSSQHGDKPSTGCIRKTTSGRETRTLLCSRDKKSDNGHTKAKKDRRLDEDKSCFVLDSSWPDREKESVANAQRSKEPGSQSKDGVKEYDENDPDKGKYITWSMVDPAILKDYDLYNWLKRQEEELKNIRSAWASCINQMGTAEMKGKEGEAIALQVERNKQMFYGVTGIDPFIDMMKENLTLDNFDVDDVSCGLNHIIRWRRFGRQDFTKHKNRLDTNVKNKTATDEELRDYLIADEMIETLDSCIEFMNYIIINNKPAQQKLPNTPVGRDVLDKLKCLTSLEMRNLMFKYFMKVVDLRENSKQMENTIADYEQKLDLAQSRINTLTRGLQEMRTQQSQLQAMANYHPPEGAYGGHSHGTTPLALTEGSKSRRGPSIPQQNLSKLQVTKTAPPPKVTIKHNKLIIEKPNNQK